MYCGPLDDIAPRIDGTHVGSSKVGTPLILGNSSGNVVLARKSTDLEGYCADFSVDEFYFWNQPLGTLVIQELYNSY